MVARWCAWGGSPVATPGDNGQDHKGDEKGEGDEEVGHAEPFITDAPTRFENSVRRSLEVVTAKLDLK